MVRRARTFCAFAHRIEDRRSRDCDPSHRFSVEREDDSAGHQAHDPSGTRADALKEPKEPLNKSRVAATEAFRDELHEATRSPWQAPMGERRDTADRPESPVPFGFRSNGLICVVARLANSTNYSLRRDA